MSSFLLQAQSSGANVIGVANAGADAVNTITQAWEFGLPQAGQRRAVVDVGVGGRGDENAHGSLLANRGGTGCGPLA